MSYAPDFKGYLSILSGLQATYQGARVRSCGTPPGKKTRSSLAREVSHEEESSPVQSLEQPDVVFWEPTKLHEV